MKSARSRRLRRVVLLNDYPMRIALSRVEAREYPAQHLWGYHELRDRYEWVIPRFGYSSVAKRFPRLEPLLWKLIAVVGDVLQQSAALRHSIARRDTIVYGADIQSSALIGALKRAHLVRCGFVLVVHNGPRNRWSRFWMGGADCIVTLDERTAHELRASMRRETASIQVLPWGPALESGTYERFSSETEATWDFVCAGRSNRHYDAVREAAQSGRIDGQIFTGSTVESFRDGTADVRSHSGDYLDVLEAINSSRCSLIPLADVDRLSGLTEAADAIALDVPVVVSDSPKYPYRMSGYGPSTIDERDPDSVVAAITALRSTSPRRRPSPLARTFNMDEYSRRLQEIFDGLG